MTQIPIYNVNNNCSTGSTGLHMARQAVSHGAADAVLVIGFEKMSSGSIKAHWKDRAEPIGTSSQMMAATRGITNAPSAAQLFGNAGREYMERYGATARDLAEIARINHAHSAANPYSQFRTAYTLDEIEQSPMIHDPLTKLQCCPTSDGAAAAIVVSASFLAAHPHLRPRAIQIAGQCLATDSPDLFDRSAMNLVGYGMSAHAGREALSEAGLAARDIRLVELHDCFSSNELLTLDALGLCPPGHAHHMVRSGAIALGGRCVVNPSGGLISKGHPLGATGLAQCAELVWQLRGEATNRLVKGARAALQHNLGLGGACVVTVYTRADGRSNDGVGNDAVGSGEVGFKAGVEHESGWLGYNAAVEARGFTPEQVDRVRSRRARSAWALGDTQKRVEARF